MARRKGGINLLGVFRQYFAEHPEWLDAGSNETVLAQFAADHPGVPMERRIKQAMFNAKNYIRSGKKKGTPGRKKKIAQMQREIATPQRSGGAMQLLEGHIDDCLGMAKEIGRDQIGDVISHLHRARNILVLKIES